MPVTVNLFMAVASRKIIRICLSTFYSFMSSVVAAVVFFFLRKAKLGPIENWRILIRLPHHAYMPVEFFFFSIFVTNILINFYYNFHTNLS